MKIKLITLVTLLLTQLSFAQTMSIEQYSEYIELGDGLPQDVLEFKDLNGVFHPYLGEWQTQINGNIVKLNISEIYLR